MTGPPPRSSKKAAHGTNAIETLALWMNDDGAKRDVLTERRFVVVPLGLGFELGE